MLKWRKALAAVLAIAMLATLLVVPASAAESPDGIYILDFSTEKLTTEDLTGGAKAGTEKYFTVYPGSIGSAEDGVSFDGGYAPTKCWNPTGNIGSNWTQRNISFTTKYPNAEVKIWWKATSSTNKTPSITKYEDKNTVYTNWGTLSSKGATSVNEVTLETPGTYALLGISDASKMNFFKIQVTDENPGTQIAPDADETTAVNTVKTAVEKALADKESVAQEDFEATAGDGVAAKAKALVELWIKNAAKNNGSVNSEVAISAEQGAKAATKTEAGTNGTFTYTITISKGSASASVTGAVEITFTAYSNRATAISLTGVPEAAKHANDEIELTAEVTLEHPEDEPTEELKWTSSNSNVVEVPAEANGKETVTVTAKAIGKATVKVTSGDAEDAAEDRCEIEVVGLDQNGIYTFDASKMGAVDLATGGVTYDNHFSAVGDYKVQDAGSVTFADDAGYSPELRFASNGTAKTDRALVIKIDNKAGNAPLRRLVLPLRPALRLCGSP